MISRYKRKPVAQKQQINQSLGKFTENHPLPEKAGSFPTPLHGDQYEAISHYRSESDFSENSSVPEEHSEASWSEFQSGAEPSTENSSVISWGFDEFDQAATWQVQKIFKQIDELLYEGKDSTLVKDLQDECQQWANSFPHLRVQGKQIVAPVDEGYSWHSTYPCEDKDSTTLNVVHAKEPSELGVFGTRLPIAITSDPKDPAFRSDHCSFSVGSEDEEGGMDLGIIMSEGIMEEYLAFDSRDKEDEYFEWSRAMSLDSLKMGYPPISPKFSRKEAIVSYLFDDVWREVVWSLEQLICRYWEESVSDDCRNDITIKTTKVGTLNPYAPLQRLPLVLPPVTHSKILAISPNLANRSQSGNLVTPRNLNDIMVVHGIPLQQRNLPLMEKVLDSDEKSVLRPTSAALISGKPRPGRSLEHSSASLTHNVPSARRRNAPRTLHPINNNPSRSGTPKMEEIIRGTRMQTANDQMSCSPVPFNRNNLLPPIASDPDHHHMPGFQRQTPDTPLGRSFVIYDHPNHPRNRRGSAGTDTESISIAVTGISLGIASSSASSSSHWGHALNEPEQKEVHTSGTPLHSLLKSHGGYQTRSRQGL
ncbi:primary cilium assembly protein FAM149B1 [Discoglossus pictus]